MRPVYYNVSCFVDPEVTPDSVHECICPYHEMVLIRLHPCHSAGLVLLDKENATRVEPSELPIPEDQLPGDALGSLMYPPPVSPTQAYQPPVPPLFRMDTTSTATSKSKRRSWRLSGSERPVPSPSSTSKSKRRSWRLSGSERPVPSTSSTSKSNRRSWFVPERKNTSLSTTNEVTRSASVASSGASSACSTKSATIEIPQPGANAYTKMPGHKRVQSDPKYIRFMSAVAENEKQAEPERALGYPDLVSRMVETQELIFRRFDEIHVRLLLYLQDHISQLETDLRRVDEEDCPKQGMYNDTSREDVDKLRVEIMERLRILVGEYDIMILAFSRMQESKASEKSVIRLQEWARKCNDASDGPVAKAELQWVEKGSDLANLSLVMTSSDAGVKQSPLRKLFPGRKR